MKTTSTTVILLRIAFIFGLFFTSCFFIDSWHSVFFLNISERNTKLVLALVIPFFLTAFVYLREKSFVFIGKASAVLMPVCVVAFFVDKASINLIARIGEDKIFFHFTYSLISFFSVLFASWCCRTFCKKHDGSFAGFVRDFFAGYTVLCVFLFVLMFFVIREYNLVICIQNFVPFKGEIGEFIAGVKNGFDSYMPFLRTIGNVLFFSSISLMLCTLIPKQKTLFAVVVPFLISLFVEAYQYISKCGDTDIDDVILNTLGAFIGILIYQLLFKKIISEDKKCLAS